MSNLFINFALFNKTEHNIKIEHNMNNETDILNRAVSVLKKKIPQQEVTVAIKDDYPRLVIMGKEFVCKIEPTLTVADLMRPYSERPEILRGENTIFVTVNANAKVLDLAQNVGINVIDCAGNYAIRHTHKNGNIFFMLSNRGESPVADLRPNTYPIFKDKGLCVIFYFLLAKENIAKPFREIQEATGVAIGTVKNIVDGMAYQQFARIEKNKRFLINIDKLLMLWGANYCQNFRPKLLQSRMNFRNGKGNDWQSIDLPKGMQWGGESAASLTDNYLTPGTFTIYADISAPTIMKTGAVLPDNEGDIFIYEKFWKGETTGTCVPAVLTYAELMDTGNGRCIEAAQRMKENELGYLF